mgnify:CR=1 FL=1
MPTWSACGSIESTTSSVGAHSAAAFRTTMGAATLAEMMLSGEADQRHLQGECRRLGLSDEGDVDDLLDRVQQHVALGHALAVDEAAAADAPQSLRQNGAPSMGRWTARAAQLPLRRLLSARVLLPDGGNGGAPMKTHSPHVRSHRAAILLLAHLLTTDSQ